MEALPVISVLSMGVTNLIRRINQNDNQNSNFYDSDEYRNMQMNYQMEINRIREESDL